MHEIPLEKELCITTLKTLTVLFAEEGGSDAVALYFFYYKQCKIQQTDQTRCNRQFCLKGLGRGDIRFDKAKGILKKYKIIEDVKKKKWYIKLNYIGFENSSTLKTTPVENHPSGIDPTNAYINKNKCLNKENKDMDEEFEGFIKSWNEVKPFGYAKKALPKIIKKTEALKAEYLKARKQYEVKEIKTAINNYIIYVNKIKPSEGNDFYLHRFDMYTFLSQKNGLSKYINFNL